MNVMIKTAALGLYAVVTFFSCNAQTAKIVGGRCEGCEAIYEYGDTRLTASDTLPEFENNEPKVKITGTVYKKDGRTPAGNVILYIYHTDRKGIYQKKADGKGWSQRHGFIRGWVKTGTDGKYTFFTFRPAAYPDASEPAHIHITVKESGINEYYLDNYIFADDPLLTLEIRGKLKNRGGSGVTMPRVKDGILVIERNIILGKNIPNYE